MVLKRFVSKGFIDLDVLAVLKTRSLKLLQIIAIC
jgi:hypothetical protein